MTKKDSVFETETCGRCGGSGNYSYCSMHGTRCFGCGGSGIRYTKRGRATKAFFEAKLRVPVSELKVGDLMWYDDFFAGKAYFAKIVSIEPDTLNAGRVIVTTEHKDGKKGGLHCGPEHVVRKGWSAEVKAAALAEAKAYGETLGKNGKPLKKAKVTA